MTKTVLWCLFKSLIKFRGYEIFKFVNLGPITVFTVELNSLFIFNSRVKFNKSKVEFKGKF